MREYEKILEKKLKDKHLMPSEDALARKILQLEEELANIFDGYIERFHMAQISCEDSSIHCNTIPKTYGQKEPDKIYDLSITSHDKTIDYRFKISDIPDLRVSSALSLIYGRHAESYVNALTSLQKKIKEEFTHSE